MVSSSKPLGNGNRRKTLFDINLQREMTKQAFGPISVPFSKQHVDMQRGGTGRTLKKLNRVIEITPKTYRIYQTVIYS